jgi:predicted DNA-binding transcriptional regulator AlpA
MQVNDTAAKHEKHVHAADTGAAYLTACVLAGMLDTSDATIYRLAKADVTMPKLVLGGVVRFPRERVMAWLRSREHGVAGRRTKPANGHHTDTIR